MSEQPESAARESDSQLTKLSSPLRPNFLWWFCRAVYRIIIFFWHRFQPEGRENIPESGAALMLVNHQSYLDPMMVGVWMDRPVSFVARDTLFKIPILGSFLRAVYVLPVKRGAVSSATIRESVRRVEHGFILGLFPEGTRSTDGEVHRFKSGFLSILKRTKVPVIPVGVSGTYAAMPKGAIFVRPKKIVVKYGEPIPFEDIANYLEENREKELVDLLRQEVIQCQQKLGNCMIVFA